MFYLSVEQKFESLLCKRTLKGFGDFHVDSHSSNMTEELDGCDLSTKTLPDGSLYRTFSI